jgi:prepilin-type N-terminal cleavage/methylation domain-containing protein
VRRPTPNGLTLIEVSLAISVVGVALCMFLPAFIQRLQFSKFEDAQHNLEALTRSVQAYYGGTQVVRGARRTRCLPASAGPSPEAVGVAPTEHVFAEGPGGATWGALQFQPPRAGRFAYTVQVSHARCGVRAAPGTPLVRVEARADLDGDGNYSSFVRELVVSEDGSLVDGELLRVRDRTE